MGGLESRGPLGRTLSVVGVSASLSVLVLSASLWVGSSPPRDEPYEGPKGRVGALAWAGQMKNKSVFALIHKPFKTPKVSISIVRLQPDVASPMSSLLLCASGWHREGSGFGCCGQQTRLSWVRLLQGLQKSCQLQTDIL